jgi:hypothetical protein
MCHEDMHQQMLICRRQFGSTGQFLPPAHIFVNKIFALWSPAWVNNVIGLHGSYLGQLPWDFFIRRVPFIEGFLSSGY